MNSRAHAIIMVDEIIASRFANDSPDMTIPLRILIDSIASIHIIMATSEADKGRQQKRAAE